MNNTVPVWYRLGLSARLFMLSGIILLVLGLSTQYFSTMQLAGEYRQDMAGEMENTLDLLERNIVDQAVIGDYTAIQQIMESIARRPFINEIAWRNEHNNLVTTRGKHFPTVAKEWFTSLVKLHPAPRSRAIIIGGKSYGVLTVQFTAALWEDRLWNAFWRQLAVHLAKIGVLMAAIAFALRQTLAALQTADMHIQRFVHGDYSVRGKISPRAPPEIRNLGTTLNRAAAKLESVLLSLSEQRGATDNAAIVSETDINGTITYVNDKFCRISGYSREEMLGANHRLLKSGVHPSGFYQELYQTLGEARVWQGEICNLAKDFHSFWLNMTITPVLDETGKPVKYVSISFDITPLKKALEKIRRDFYFQQAINAVLQASLSEAPLEIQMEWALEAIHSVPWIGKNTSAGIFLADDDNPSRLKLHAQRGMPHLPADVCESASNCQCVCRHAMSSRHVTRSNGINPGCLLSDSDGIPQHAELVSIPVRSGKRIFGVLALRLAEGAEILDDDIEFLQSVTTAIAGIIEHKQTAYAMQRLGQIVNSAHDEVYVFDAETLRFTQANQGACSNLGYAQAELKAKTPLDIKPLIRRKQFDELLQPLRSGEQKQTVFETIHRRKDGSTYPVEVRLEFICQDPAPSFLALIQDITERRQAEAALKESEEKYKAMTGNVPGMVFQLLLKAEGRLAFPFASEGAASVCGFSASEITGHAEIFLDQILPDDRETFFSAMSDSVRSFSAWNWEGRINTPQQDIKWLNWRCSPRLQPNGDVLWDGIVFNITESKLSELEITQSREQLRALSSHLQTVREEEKAHIAREIHDELGGTLTALKMDAFWLARRMPPEMAAIREKIEAMSNLIDTAVHTTRRIVTELRPTVLDDLGLVAAIEWQLNEFQKRMGIQCQLTKPDEEITVDSLRAVSLFRIVQESLTNIARHAGATQISVTLDVVDRLLFMSIYDNGRGIPEARIANPTSHGVRGMFERAGHLGGEMHILGAPGAGTSVIIIFPLTMPASIEPDD